MTVLINPRVIPKGPFGPTPGVQIAAAPVDRTLMLQILSNDWTTNEVGLVIDFAIEISTDNGQTWQPAVSGTCLGGAVNGRTGALPSIGIGTVPANTPLRFRGNGTLNQKANSLGIGYELI